MISFKMSCVLCTALLVPVAVMASEPHRSESLKNDQNRIVCRSAETTGSRLSQTKRCRTLAEWAQDKQADRQEIERIQNNRYKSN